MLFYYCNKSSRSASTNNVHSMVTRNKDGTHRPKVLSITCHPLPIALHAIIYMTKPTCFSMAVKGPEWRAAMALEFDIFQYNGTWSLVPALKNMNIVGCKWVYKLKQKVDGSIEHYTGQLVAKGFHQQAGVDFTKTFSPVAKPTTIHIVLSLAIRFNWPIRQLYVNNAFLNSELHRRFICNNPKDLWTSNIQTIFVDYTNHYMDSSKFLWPCSKDSQTICFLLRLRHLPRPIIICVTLFQYLYHLVIILTGNNPSSVQALIREKGSAFAMKDLGPIHYFLGLEVHCSSDKLFLSQTKYVVDLL